MVPSSSVHGKRNAPINDREQRALRRQVQVATLRRQAHLAAAQHKDRKGQLREQEKQPAPPMPQHQAQVAWGLEVLLQAAETVKAQDQTPVQATLTPSTLLQSPQSREARPPELVLPTSELPLAAPVANTLSHTSTAPPPSPSTTKPKNMRKYKPKYKSDVWRSASGTADGDTTTTTKKRKGRKDPSNPPRQRRRRRKEGSTDSEDENDPPETPEEAEFLEDMNNPIGLALSTHGGYKSGFRRWREFCNNHKETYSGVDGKDLFLVNSEDKLIAFLVECYFSKTSKKHVRIGADFKTVVASDFDADGRPLPVDSDTLVKLLEAAEFDKSGCKVIDVPLGKGSIKLAKKVLLRLHGFQLKRGQVSGLSPTEGSKYQEAVQRHKESQVQQNLQSSHIRSADCAIRDSYNLTTFNDMVSYLWEKKTQEIRDPDLNYRELFCMTSRHNMLLRDEDLRNLNLSDCFASVITKPRHPGIHQLVSLTFKLNKGKTNIGNENWYACCMRHEDIRRCSFSAFAFYMFQLWQNSDHPNLRGLVVDDPLELSKDEWDLFKMLPSPLDPTQSISPQATYNAVKKLYDRFHVNSSKRTHGGRHAGTVESNHLGIPNDVIKEGGRWMAERGKMETYYSSNLPSAFALGMAGFQDKAYHLPRNGVSPSHELQKLVFPWIEDVYGKNNKEWEEECKAEMDEVDGNIVPPISAGPSSTLAKALEESNESSRSTMMMAYQDRDIAKAGFLRLLIRCRRIILQDAAFRLHHKQKSLILDHEIIQLPLFTEFQQELGDYVDKPTPNPLLAVREAMPELVSELQSMSTRLHHQETTIQTFVRDHQQQIEDQLNLKEQALKEQKEHYERALAQQRQQFIQQPHQRQHYHQHLPQHQQQHQQQHYQQPAVVPLIQLRGVLDTLIQQHHQPPFFSPASLGAAFFQGQQNQLPLAQVPASYPPYQVFMPPNVTTLSSWSHSQANSSFLSTFGPGPQPPLPLTQRVPIPRLSSPAPAQVVGKTKEPRQSKEKPFRFVIVTQK